MNSMQKNCLHEWAEFMDQGARYCTKCEVDHPENKQLVVAEINPKTGKPRFRAVDRLQFSSCPVHCTIEGPGVHNHVVAEKKWMVVKLTDKMNHIRRPSDTTSRLLS